MNIFDIAKKTGYSIATVSRVINNTGLVKETTREKILQVMRENNYTPNSMAQGLARRESTTIGMIVPNINNPFYSEMVRAVQDFAKQDRYAVVAVNTDDNLEEERRILSILIGKQVDGLIFAGGRDLDDMHNAHVREVAKKIPTVFICEDIDDPHIYCVNVAKEAAMRMLTSHLIGLGHRDIYFVNTPEGFKPSREKQLGYRAALREHGIPFHPSRILHGQNTILDGYQAGERIAASPGSATAIVAASDIMAMGILNALLEAGAPVPGRFSVAGFDNIVMSRFFTPSLTTVGSNLYEMAQQAAIVLERLITGKTVEERVTMLPPKLIVRDSCAAPA